MTTRELFELWAKGEGYSIDSPEGPGIYFYKITNDAWFVWQACSLKQTDTDALGAAYSLGRPYEKKQDLAADAGKEVDECEHPRWAAYYTGANHTHWICDVCDKKVQNLNYSRNIISTPKPIPGVNESLGRAGERKSKES